MNAHLSPAGARAHTKAVPLMSNHLDIGGPHSDQGIETTSRGVPLAGAWVLGVFACENFVIMSRREPRCMKRAEIKPEGVKRREMAIMALSAEV